MAHVGRLQQKTAPRQTLAIYLLSSPAYPSFQNPTPARAHMSHAETCSPKNCSFDGHEGTTPPSTAATTATAPGGCCMLHLHTYNHNEPHLLEQPPHPPPLQGPGSPPLGERNWGKYCMGYKYVTGAGDRGGGGHPLFLSFL